MAVSVAEVAANFAGMSDAELLDLWAQGKGDFTSEAWRELRLEAERRGLERPVRLDEDEKQLNNTGGWLAVYQIFQVLTVLGAARGLAEGIKEHWTGGVVMFALMIGVLMFGLLLIISRHRAARPFWVGYHVLTLVAVAAILVVTRFESAASSIGAVVWSGIWLRYWFTSTRVRVVFGYR